MIVNLHIEKLVLDGLPLGAHEGPLLQAAVEAELGRLLPGAGFPAVDRTTPLIRSGTLAGPAASPKALGARIGAAVFAALTNE